MHAEKAVRKLSRSEKKYWSWFLRMKAEMEDEAYMNMLKKDRSIEIAKKLKARGYSLEEIAENTDLSLEVVEKL